MKDNRFISKVGTLSCVAALVAILAFQVVTNVQAISSSNVTTYNQWTAVEGDCNFVVFTDGTTYYRKSCDTGAIDSSGSTASTVIQAALDGLTTSRTTKETVILRGPMTITASISIPSYTILQIEGKLTRSGNGYHLLSVASTTDVEIRGGIIQSAAKGAEDYNTNEINLNACKNCIVEGVTIKNAAEDAIRVHGASENIKLLKNSIYTPNRHAIDIVGSSLDNVIVSGNYVNETLIYDGITVYTTALPADHTITIVGNTIENVNGTAGSSSAIHVEDTTPSNLNSITITGNSIYNGKHGITTAAARPIAIVGNVIRDTNRGLQLQNPVLSTITSNVIDNSEVTTTNYCIYLYGMVQSTLSNNICRGAASGSVTYGIYWDESGSFMENTISGNFFGRMLDGVRYAGSKNVYDSNIFRHSEQMGIRIQDGSQYNIYSNNLFYNSGTAIHNTYFDINMEASSGANTISQTITDNIFLADSSNDVARHINFTSPTNTNNIIVTGNRFTGSVSGAFSATLPTSSVIINNNIGFVTEAEGTGIINSGATTSTITHGLGYTPSASEIKVTFTEDPSNTPGATFITSISSTQFTVNVESDPGASNLDFSWAVQRIG